MMQLFYTEFLSEKDFQRMLERKYIRARQKFYIEEMLSFALFYNRYEQR